MTPIDCQILRATWEMFGFQASMFPECFFLITCMQSQLLYFSFAVDEKDIT